MIFDMTDKMTEKDTHIVFGRFAENILLESKAIDSDKAHIIVFEDRLNVGTICDLHSIDSIEKRKKWLLESFGNTDETDYYLKIIDEDIAILKTLIENAKHVNKLYIWNGFSASEIVNTARLLFHLSESIKEIYMTDFPNIPIERRDGVVIYPEILAVTAPEQVIELKKHFKLVSNDCLQRWVNLWHKFMSEEATLRILGEDGEIYVKDEDFYDSSLISGCNEEYQSASRVIGYTLCDTNFNVRDSFLNWRLKQLVLSEKLKAQGELKEMRDYKVMKI